MRFQPTVETLAIVQRLGGHWNGRYALVPCPAHEDRTPSLSIRQGRNSILVHCFAGCDGGDVMQAIRHVLGHPVGSQRALPVPANDRIAPFQRLWSEGVAIAGTLAHRYLREIRGITLLPPDVRFHPACPMGRGPSPKRLPALLVGVFHAQLLIAIQRLFLDPVTGQRTHRMMLGNSRGGTWPASLAGDTMRIAEGFETACAYHQLTGREAGTSFGLRNFAGFAVGSGIRQVILLPDNDHEGMQAASAAIAARQSPEQSFRLERCPAGFNDWAEMTRPPVHMSTAS
ncbi:hypothetical protein GTZ99_11790 [Novosphingobium sp. FSY-8]|uniref:Toprim domain-containing protein n=1 Tax=Novosphingobium ovatum TaxID=1908523 RepID=A0ABW9XFC6_9SPHN|nr:toprim domain-containing protein [Novosphingobium ovatum]NBC37237.1 hypothetical protein [Novosphingobium ovatum]